MMNISCKRKKTFTYQCIIKLRYTAGIGECGACNVIINGECFNSCIYLAVWADGKEITAAEGLLSADGELKRGHLCRCTGYKNIFFAVRKLAGLKAGS